MLPCPVLPKNLGLPGPRPATGELPGKSRAGSASNSGTKLSPTTDQFETIFDLAVKLAKSTDADALLLLADGQTDWRRIRNLAGGQRMVVAADSASQLEGASDEDLATVVLDMADSPIHEKLRQALLESVADEILPSGARVVTLYSGFEAGTIDSISVIHLGEHLERLTARDLRQLETYVPLDTLKTVVDLAVEIGREGREGKPVGTLFVVGDTRKVLTMSHPTGFDPVRGYNRKERNLSDRRVREGIKEIAQMDGAFVDHVARHRRGRLPLYRRPGRQHHALQRAGRAPLGGRRHQSHHAGRGRRRERVDRHRSHLSERRSRAANRALPPTDEVERLRVRTAGGGVVHCAASLPSSAANQAGPVFRVLLV